METIEKVSIGFFNSAGFKLGLIIVLSLLLLIPASMIRGLIHEREQRRDETIQEVTSVWGNAQTICGPALTVQIKSIEKSGDKDFKTIVRNVHFLPENLKVEGTVEPEVRNRGIYRVVTYRAKLHITGNFAAVDFKSLNIDSNDISIEKAWIEIGISDMRGINEDIEVKFKDSIFTVIPGIPGGDISESGVHCAVPSTLNTTGNFAFDLDMNGSHSLNFIPVGKDSRINLSSTWNSPSFTGAFLPDVKNVTETGFTANWNTIQLNRNYPQQWIDNQYSVKESSFGVELITPVDTYQKSERSVKYAILFIGLTFLIFFFSESLTKVRVHPVNYLLVGVALCIFYSLLTALAEHMSFAYAFITGSLVIIAMIAVFAHSLYKKWKVTITITASLIALYVFLFVILQLIDYSLLMGNIGLVIILGLVMYFSRKIDWYSKVKSIEESKE